MWDRYLLRYWCNKPLVVRNYNNATIPFLKHRHESIKTLLKSHVSNCPSSRQVGFLPRYQDDSSAKGKIRWLIIESVLSPNAAYLIQEQYMGLLQWKHRKGNTRLLSSTKSWNLLKASPHLIDCPAGSVVTTWKIRTLSYHWSENCLNVIDILVHFFQETWKRGTEQDSCWASEYRHDAVQNIHW